MQNCQFVRHAQGARCSLEQRPNPAETPSMGSQRKRRAFGLFSLAPCVRRGRRNDKKCRRPTRDAGINFFVVLTASVETRLLTYFG
jgi:hypothetical protein